MMYTDFIKELRKKIQSWNSINIELPEISLENQEIGQSLTIVGNESSVIRIKYEVGSKEYHVTDSIKSEITEFISSDPMETVDYIYSLLMIVKDFLNEVEYLIKDGEI